MFGKKYSGEEYRKYIRLDSVFPVAFRLLSLEGGNFLSDWLQGFTNNISKGGICLSVNNLCLDVVKALKNKQAKLSLGIDIPLHKKPVAAQAKITWIKDAGDEPNKYLIGLSYEQIDARQNSRIMRYAWTKKLFAPVAFSIIIILVLGLAANAVISAKLIKGNKALVEQLVKILQESSVAKQKVKEINRERTDLQLKIQALESRIQTAEEDRQKLNEEKDALQEQLILLQGKETAITEELLRLDERKATLEKANLDKMYLWLKTQQDPYTGLAMSFEGSNWALIDDQALLIQAYAYFSDFARARKILDFFRIRARRGNGLFFNAYDVHKGIPVEQAIHSGPNIRLGIAIAQYSKKSQGLKYLSLAEEIAQRVMNLPDQEKDSLDAYAFFNMLYKITAKAQYLQARDKALEDALSQSDTYARSIAAIGPEKLEESGMMSPDRIVESAEENSGVETEYIRPEGQSIKIKGFAFASEKDTGRTGIISSERTAQMILAFKILTNFYYKKGMVAKARAYEGKADMYLAQLGNIVISSLSASGRGESCLPYATQDIVGAVYSCPLPKGKSGGSLAGTAYTLFAYYNYNPWELAE